MLAGFHWFGDWGRDAFIALPGLLLQTKKFEQAREVFETLSGYGIPYTCLVGPDGKLLAQHLRGPGMVDQVKEHLPDGNP